jgi:N-acetylmuramoyl-L-alanine amidase
VVLDVARRLKAMIEKEMPGIQVKLTRDDDRFVELEQRTALANTLEADLFFSIHANASRKRGRSSGIETYFMNFASDKEAEELAAKENAYSQLNQAKLNNLLKRITLNNKKEESRELASFVQTNLYRHTKPVNRYAQNRGVRSAPFVVLIGAQVPSVLVEISFIDHPVEGKLLLNDSYRDRIARGLLGGIKAYVESLQ